MLEKYLEQLASKRQAHQIAPDQFESWKENLVTQRLFEELIVGFLDDAGDLQVDSDMPYFVGKKSLSEYILKWTPEELRREDES